MSARASRRRIEKLRPTVGWVSGGREKRVASRPEAGVTVTGSGMRMCVTQSGCYAAACVCVLRSDCVAREWVGDRPRARFD